MNLKWEWFLGGKSMFWMAVILFVLLIISFVLAYVVDLTSVCVMSKQDLDTYSIEMHSNSYLARYGIKIDMPIEYSFVSYKHNKKQDEDVSLLGTFHEWNGTYYINISVNLYKTEQLEEIANHETRHMIVEYLKDQKIIDLTKYTEEIAYGKNSYYNNLFDGGVYLLRTKQEAESLDSLRYHSL